MEAIEMSLEMPTFCAVKRAMAARMQLLTEINGASWARARLAPLAEPINPYQTVAERAIDVAFAHHAGQLRHNGDFYVTHPIAATRLALQWGGDTKTVLTGLFHDVVEDSAEGSQATLSAIAKEFGAQVAWNVFALTKSQAIDDKDARNRDAFQRVVDCVSFGQLTVAAVKLADRLHNSVTAQNLSPAKRARLQQENRQWYAPLARQVGAKALVPLFSNEALDMTEADLFAHRIEPWLPQTCAAKHELLFAQ